MKSLKILLLIVLLTVFTGCGGGGTDPDFDRDLSGLEGVWAVMLTQTGDLYYAGGVMPVSIDIAPTFVFTTMQITDDDGEPMTWIYDGQELVISGEYWNEYWDPALGNVYEEGMGVLNITITPDSTTAVIAGNTDAEIESEHFGIMTGNLVYSGTMTIQ